MIAGRVRFRPPHNNPCIPNSDRQLIRTVRERLSYT